MKLEQFKKNIFSQFGEDGIIEEIFSRIEPESKICVEFGSWDGLWLSNTANLWKNKNWKAVLIESDLKKVQESYVNTSDYNVISLNYKVGYHEEDCLEKILNKNNINDKIDLLSIDIDGNEYYILKNLKITPSLIVVEYNPTIPYWIECYQAPNEYFGASLGALNQIATTKNYFLAAVTETNAFFIHNKYKKLFSDCELSIAELAYKKHYKFIITDYSGNYLSVGKSPYGEGNLLDNKKVYGL